MDDTEDVLLLTLEALLDALLVAALEELPPAGGAPPSEPEEPPPPQAVTPSKDSERKMGARRCLTRTDRGGVRDMDWLSFASMVSVLLTVFGGAGTPIIRFMFFAPQLAAVLRQF
jgi:hypothetical protein